MKAGGTLIFGCVFVLAMAPGRRATASRSNVPAAQSVSKEIEHLGDRSATERAAAYEALRLSADANLRPALLEASHHSTNPQIRERAAKLLCNLSWSRPDDPENVQSILRNYRTPSVEQRIEVLGQLGAAWQVSVPVLIRLLQEDPSDDVRWAIVATLRAIDTATDALQKLNPAPDDAPMLAAAGWGWQDSDPDRAARFFRQSVDLAMTRGADDHGEIENMLELLSRRATNRGEFADAIELSRAELWYNEFPPEDFQPEQAIAYFFAQYAQHGLGRDFDRDVRTFAPYFKQPEMMYVLGKIFAAQGKPLAADACFISAWHATGEDSRNRSRVADFLVKNGWCDLARPQLQQALSRPAPDSTNRDAWVIYANLGLCDDALGDQLQAAVDFDHAEKLIRAIGSPAAEEIANRYAAMANWYRLRDATTKRDHARIEQLANQLFANDYWKNEKLAGLDTEIDLIRALESLDRKSDADQVFDSAYKAMQKIKVPHDAEWMNNLAWLCARGGKHLDEAYRLSRQAVRLAPANAANLDTAAEASAALGKWNEAVDLEAAALKLQPGDRFMTAQIQRFKAKGK